MKVQGDTTAFTEEEFLKRLKLDDPSILGLKGLCINGRFLATIENVRTIDVIVWKVVDDEEHFFKP